MGQLIIRYTNSEKIKSGTLNLNLKLKKKEHASIKDADIEEIVLDGKAFKPIKIVDQKN